jgi:hypothetical protein
MTALLAGSAADAINAEPDAKAVLRKLRRSVFTPPF